MLCAYRRADGDSLASGRIGECCMTLTETFFFVALFVLLFFIVFLGVILPVFKRHKEATGSIVNFNSSMTKFVYKVDFNSEKIIRSLQTQNIKDEITFCFNETNSIVTVSENDASQKYCCTILEYEGYAILRLEKIHFLDMQSHIQYKLNPCIIRKLSAELVPFSEYGF